MNWKGEKILGKYLILIPIFITTVVIVLIILPFLIKGCDTEKSYLIITEPINSVDSKPGGTFSVKGKVFPKGNLNFSLKSKSGKQKSELIIDKFVDSPPGDFQQEIKLPDDILPRKYVLIVSTANKSKSMDVNITPVVKEVPKPTITPPTITKSKGNPPGFYYNDKPLSDVFKAEKGKDLIISVKDEDNDLIKVWNEVLEPTNYYELKLLASSMTGNFIVIDAIDKAGNSSKLKIEFSTPIIGKKDNNPPVFYVNDEPKSPYEKVILKSSNPIKIKIVDDDIIRKVVSIIGTKEYNESKIDYQITFDRLKEGTNDITATDGGNNSNVITLIKDTKPPSFSVQNPLYMKPGSVARVKVTDSYGLFKFAGIDIVGTDYELDIQSDSLKFGENPFEAYDAAGNKSILSVIKYRPLEAKLCSPLNIITRSKTATVCVEVKNGFGSKSVLVNGRPNSIPKDGENKLEISLQIGQNRLSMYAKDDVDSISLGTITAIMDATPPEIISVNGEQNVGDPIRIIRDSKDYSNIISISDESGIDKIILNKNELAVVDKTSPSMEVSIPANSLKIGTNEIIISDKAGNTTTRSIVFSIIEKPTGMLADINRLVDNKNYSKAESLVNEYEKKRPGPSTDLYRGIISYGKEEYDKSIEYLVKAYQLREKYDKNSPNIEYNLLYLGLAHYQLWQKNVSNKNLSYKALEYLGQLDKPDVKLRAPEPYSKARNTIASIQAGLKK